MRLLYISHDQLSLTSGILASANPESDVIVMVESSRLIESKKWHRGRLWFLLSAARHFAEELRNLGFQVHYVKAASTVAGIESMMKETAPGMFLLREAEQWAEVDELRDSARGDPAQCSVQGLRMVTRGGTDAL